MRWLILLAAPLLTLSAEAQPPGHRRPPPPHEILADNAEDLGIDSSTLAEANRIAEAARPELEALHEEARASHEAVRERQKQMVDDLMALLTPAQQAEFKALLPKPPPERRPPPRR